MSDRLLTVASFGSPFEAVVAKNSLETEGITVYLGEEQSVGLWGMNSNLGTIKLDVAEADWERASGILNSLQEKDEEEATNVDPALAQAIQEGWTCSRCGAEVSPAATVCSACGDSIDDWDELSPPPSTAVTEMLPEELEAKPLVEELTNSAWRAAVLGLVLFPPLGHFYSLWLLTRLLPHWRELSREAKRRMLAALALDGAVFGLIFFFMFMLVSTSFIQRLENLLR